MLAQLALMIFFYVTAEMVGDASDEAYLNALKATPINEIVNYLLQSGALFMASSLIYFFPCFKIRLNPLNNWIE